ncbi:MAG: Gmad2 immunoglobulin-like domain-containing protein [Candidatus Saccharimonadales bacterium]
MNRPSQSTQIIGIILILMTVVVLAVVGWMWLEAAESSRQVDNTPSENTTLATEYTSESGVKVRVTAPESGVVVSSPLVVRGEVPGNWSFEASFPVRLLDEEGVELATAIATLEDDWMTEELVSFSAELEFDAPESERGTLVLEKSNPSGLAAQADKVTLPLRF